MFLNEIFEKAPKLEIKCLAVDSRTPMEDGIFFCIHGIKNDGHLHVKQAIDNGAKVIVYHDDIDTSLPAIYIRVDDVTAILNVVAKKFYGDPTSKMDVYGVTGTNGKTTIASLISQLVNPYKPCGYIGTVGITYGDTNIAPSLTTPTILENNKYLAKMYDSGIRACAIEVSSIGIEQKRTDSIDFDVAIYTNLTHDHLDYHVTMQDYFLAKKRFFDNLKYNAIAITNIDDEYGREIIKDTNARVVTYGINNEADYMATEIKLNPSNSSFVLKYAGKSYLVNTNLVALFNIYNLLGVIAALNETGYSLDMILPKLSSLSSVTGRMHRIDVSDDYNIIVDFAHTPDGLQQVFEYAKTITPLSNSIIVVFGSAGRRDTIKRKVFGELADRYCDMIILTEDDPRDESPLDIAKEIASGIKEKQYIIVESREEAIHTAISLLNKNDTLLILGKGDEKFIYRSFGKETYKGDDILAEKYIKERIEEENEII